MSDIPQTTSLSLNSVRLPGDAGEVPEWVHLLPIRDGLAHTNDKRGPYQVGDPAKIIATSFAGGNEPLIDINHSTDKAASLGGRSDAFGWITEMDIRENGIWGRVDWSKEGRDLLASRAYRYISPVIALPNKDAKNVIGILRASLTNRPNMCGITALNQETDDMSFHNSVAKLLGLDPDASESDITTAVKAAKDGAATALQSQLSEIGTALGVTDGGDVLAAAKAAKKDPTQTESAGEIALQAAVTGLQAENVILQTNLSALTTDRALEKATGYVTGEMEKGRMIPSPLRDHYIAMHQEDPTRVEKEIAALPMLSGALIPDVAPESGSAISLNATDLAAKATVYQATQATAGNEISISAAVRAVQEDKA